MHMAWKFLNTYDILSPKIKKSCSHNGIHCAKFLTVSQLIQGATLYDGALAMNNYNDVLTQLQLGGLVVDALDTDGKVHRCRVDGSKEYKGWYLLHAWKSGSGQEFIVGSFGVWQGTQNNTTKVELSSNMVMDDADRNALKSRLAEDKKRAKAYKEVQAKKAAFKASSVWAKLQTTPTDGKPNEYLTRKGIQSHGFRYTDSGALAIPLQNASGDTKGLQFILPSHHPRVIKTGRDKEYWPAGMEKTSHWFQIGSPHSGAVALVAEGAATAATLHEATGLPVTIAFDAGNLDAVVKAVKNAYRLEHVLVCADDDYLQKCQHCKKPTLVDVPMCLHCQKEHGQNNPGCQAAASAALSVAGAWVKPVFPADRGMQKLTDFNDLYHFPQGGLAMVRAQIDSKIMALGWGDKKTTSSTLSGQGNDASAMVARIGIDDAAKRYWGTYGMGGKILFDGVERMLVTKDDVLNLLPSHGWDNLKNHPEWRVARECEIGFDPTNQDTSIKCNLFGGWPVLDPLAEPQFDPITRRITHYANSKGDCSTLLDLLRHMCSNESNSVDVFDWICKWMAYPLQHPGAKMHSTVVVHGPQGTGKNRFFEAYATIFGNYGRVLGQEALEDKFNSDWAEKKLFILADEVLTQQDMYSIKNRLKGFITGGTIRVNPKNVAAHNEKNQMNICFTSNETRPLILENDDRRHCVIWVPPKLDDKFYDTVTIEINNGGIVALHDYLLLLDLGDFKPWTRPPMTSAKKDLIMQSVGSIERFLDDWRDLELEGQNSTTLPFCPCLGTSLYKVYEKWAQSVGEKPRRAQELIGNALKRQCWQAWKVFATWEDLNDSTNKSRKMFVPSPSDMVASVKLCKTGLQAKLQRDAFASQGEWLCACHHQFEMAVESKSAYQ
jgi:putative DNA primase/helicase